MGNLKTIFVVLFFSIGLSSCSQETIIGVWEVNTDYYQAIYEVVEDEGTFFGKVHYFNDGAVEHKGTDSEKDYFLTDVKAQDGSYVNGKMYMPDGSYYEVIFHVKDANTLEARMTVQGEPYSEIWTRRSNYNITDHE